MAQLLPRQYAKILYGLTEGKKGNDLDRSTKVFATFLKKSYALKSLPYIVKELEALVLKKEGKEPIHVKSAGPLSSAVQKSIQDIFGKKADITTEIDKTLIGGVTIRQGNTIFDASIITQLAALKQELI